MSAGSATATVAQRLQSARLAKGETQEDVARAVGVVSMTISRYERGLYLPETPVAKKLAEHFGVTVDWIMGGDAIVESRIERDEGARAALLELLDQWDPEAYGPPPDAEEQEWINTRVDFRADRNAGLEVTPALIRSRILEYRRQRRGRAIERPKVDVKVPDNVLRPARGKRRGPR